MRRVRGMEGMRGALMRGITLSESQERALRDVRVKHISAMKPLQVEMISARADAEIAQLKGDQKALDAANARLESVRDKVRKLMEERSPTSDLRSVLTPDQQKILDKNLAEGAQRRASMRGMQQGRGMRGMRAPGGTGDFRPGSPR
jgi:Spy/CpxP family protein refolding chaperone